MPKVRQTNFGAGEFSPSLYGADDLEAYKSGSRTLRNFLVSKKRTLVTRPGTVMCGEVKDSTKTTRLLPFNFSDDQAYVIEAGDQYFRFWKSDGTSVHFEEAICFGYYGAGDMSRVRSTDGGSTWVSFTLPGAVGILAACQAGGGRVVAVGSGTSARFSDDGGNSWSTVALGMTTGEGIAYNGHRVIAIGPNGICRSEDNGATWVACTAPTMERYGIAWGNGRWVVVGCVGNKARYSYSYDGIAWSDPLQVGSLDSEFSSVLYCVCFVAGQFICGGNSASGGIWCSLGVLSANAKWALWGTAATGPCTAVASDGISKAMLVGDYSDPVAMVYDAATGIITDLTAGIPASSGGFYGVDYHRGSWILVGDGLIRKYTAGTWSSPTIPVFASGPLTCVTGCKGPVSIEVVTDYAASMLGDLSHTQSGDILTMFFKYLPPKELRRYSEYDWRLVDWYKVPPTQTITGLAFNGTPDQTGDALHPPKAWQWVVTWEDEETGRESLACAALTPATTGKIVCYPDKPVTLQWNTLVKARRYYVYRGRNGEWGYVGSVKQPIVAAGYSPTVTYFNDDGQVPVVSEDPPLWDNPFKSDLAYPICGCYFDDRLVVGGSLVQPATVKGSATSDYYDFDEHFITDAADAFEFTLATRRFEEIRWIIPLESLIIGTSEGEWVVGGAQGEALSAQSVVARERSNQGSDTVQPVVVGEGILYLQPGAQVVRDFAFQAESSQWGGQDRTIYSTHLFEGHSIVSWAYQQKPDPTIWAVREDGVLLSLACMRELNVWAWARHDSTGGLFEDVCVVPCGNVDVPFFVVKRGAKRFIERLALDESFALEGLGHFDCAQAATFYTIEFSDPVQSQLTGLPYPDGTVIGVWVIGEATRYELVAVTGGEATVNGVGVSMSVGIPITVDFETLDFPEGRSRRKIVQSVSIEFRSRPALVDGNAFIQVGESLTQLSNRLLSSAENEVLSVPVDTSWNPGGRCAVRLTYPAAIEIRGISREVV